jgi:predicted nucleic acid-binding protein
VSRFVALLDACVLVPVALTDTLLRLAESELYTPLWSARILSEATRAVIRVHPELDPERVRHRFRQMDAAFEGASIEGWEPLEPNLSLPDPDDRHVPAAAILGRADVIVTANLSDFPADALQAYGVEAISALPRRNRRRNEPSAPQPRAGGDAAERP